MPYVRRRRTTRRRTLRSRRSTRTSRRPARLKGKSIRRYRKNQSLAKMLTPLAEVKLKGVMETYPNRKDVLMGYIILPIGAGSPVATGYTIENPLSMWNYKQGTGVNERESRSLYVKHTKMQMRVSYTPAFLNYPETRLVVPQFCRFIVVRNKTQNRLQAIDFASDLFMGQEGFQKGITTITSDFQLSKAPINRTKYVVCMDKKFCLSPSSVTSRDDMNATDTNSTRQFTSKYPSFKDINLNIPIGKKVRYIGTTDNVQDLPTDYTILCLHYPIGGTVGGQSISQQDGQLNLDVLGTTSALDM